MASRRSVSRPVTVNDLLDGHSGLDIECLDRIYLNTYVPSLQTPGQITGFLTRHEGAPIPSPVVVERRGNTFRRAVESFAVANNIPVVRFAKTDRKIDVIRPLMAKAARTGRAQVVAVGVAQEFQRVATGTKSTTATGAVWFRYGKADRRVTCYYFYVWDEDFGPAFLKLCAYFPYPGKIWVNGHEWAKRQAAKAGIAFTELSNGFASCEDPAALQAICDRLGPGTIGVFAERWWARLPLPFEERDRKAGYWWEISMRQVETSRTIVFDAPRRARAFFEALCSDNLDLGRPDNMEIVFDRRVQANTPGGFKTAIDRDNDGVVINAFYKHSRIKQYLKDGRALRIETVVAARRIWGSYAVWNTSTSSRPRAVTPTAACCRLSVSARAASLRAQPLSGSHTPPSRTAGRGPRPCGSATLGSWPWPARWPCPSTPSPERSPTRACVPW
jgi:hypothetical protein